MVTTTSYVRHQNERDEMVTFFDDFLPVEDLREVKELARSVGYEDSKSIFSHFMPDIGSDHRLFKSRLGLVDEHGTPLPLAKLGNNVVDSVIIRARDLLCIPEDHKASVSFSIMPNSSSINLHIDSSYSGAFQLYLTEEWTIENGGELVVYPDLDVEHEDFKAIWRGQPIRQEKFKNIIGHAIAPIDNRLVCIPHGMPHRVETSKLYKGAGRLSLSGFFHEQK